MRLLAAVFLASLVVLPACAATQSAVDQSAATLSAPIAARDVLYARPFTLGTPYKHAWMREQPMVSVGTLLVLEVDPALVVPRNALEPVLYAGDTTVRPLNDGHLSGRVIVIVPGVVDLATTPIWFGTPELPERVTSGTVRAERARAEKAGIRPFPSARIAAVLRPAVSVANLAVLLRDVVADLVYEYAPEEKELADSWRLPVAGAAPGRQSN